MPRERDEAWQEVGRHVGELGSRLREHYQNQVEGKDRPPSDTRDAAAGVLEDLARRVGGAFDAMSEAVHDREVREAALRASRAFGDALEKSVADLGDGVRKAGKQAGKRAGKRKDP